MCWLEVRSEQLVIGAVLAGRTPPPAAVLLQTSDFEHPVAGGLYADILHMQAAEPSAGVENVTAGLAKLYDEQAGINADMLTQYAKQAAGADDALIALAYHRVLQEGSERAIQETTAALRRVPEDNEPQSRAGHYARLGLALHRRNQVLETASAEDDNAHNEFASWNPDRADIDRPAKPSRERVAAEELVLAGLAQHPATIFAVTGWFSERIFTDLARRNLYRTMTEHLLPSTTSTHPHYLQKALKKLHVFDCPHDMQRAREQALTVRAHRLQVTASQTVSVARQLHQGSIR